MRGGVVGVGGSCGSCGTVGGIDQIRSRDLRREGTVSYGTV